MGRLRRALISLVVIITFTCAVCVVRPQPVHADTSTETVLIVLGAVIGGLALFALIMTLIVRNNPAWMPLGPVPDATRNDGPWGGGPPGGGTVKFGPACGVRADGVPLLCWR